MGDQNTRTRRFPIVPMIGVTTAWFAFHWDIATHIDVGRDGFLTPQHCTILVGAGIAFVGAALRSSRLRRRNELHLGDVTATAGGVLVVAALMLDNTWHGVFGEDVTVWSPPHLLLMTAFLLIIWGVLRSVTAAGFHPVVLCTIAAFVWAIPALAFIEFEVGVPPFTVLVEPIVWAAVYGFAIGCALAATRGWKWTATTTSIAMFGLQAAASIGNHALGRSYPIPRLGLVAAGIVVDQLRNRRRRETNGDAPDSVAIAAGAAVLIVCVALERSIAGRTLWTPSLVLLTIVPCVVAAVVAHLLAYRGIQGAFFGAVSGRHVLLATVVAFLLFAPTGYPLLTRSNTRIVHAQVAVVGSRFIVRVPRANAFDQASVLVREAGRAHQGEGSLHWVTRLSRDDAHRFSGALSPAARDNFTSLLIWYAHGVRHFYGSPAAVVGVVPLGETNGDFVAPQLDGAFSIGSFVALFFLIGASMVVLFRPDWLGRGGTSDRLPLRDVFVRDGLVQPRGF